MQHLATIFEEHALLVVFINVLLSRGGLPLPVVPSLMAAAALASPSPYKIGEVIVAGFSGALIADIILYSCGLRYGQHFLGRLCRVSFSPDFCVRSTETIYGKVGPWSLICARFIPGVSLISVAMAGVSRMSALTFLVLDGFGVLLFVGASVLLGIIFQDAIASVVATLVEFGTLGAVAVFAALGLYMLIKWWQRQLFISQLRMDRITVAELRKLIDDGRDLITLDVRPKVIREEAGVIPGAIAAHPKDIDHRIKDYSRDLEIVVYCACPNEESAATAARHLKREGFKKIRPLLGGIEAWVEAGQPIERVQSPHD
jgi:membrane protein DedA with SNARE-associated domain/rhodanese-related sulfurtransferase